VDGQEAAMRATPVFALASFAFGVAALLHVPAIAAPPSQSAVAWQVASTEADVDRAFELARQQGKPLFFYWGAVWCPPCNQVKATLFSRPEFVERSRAFVPVYVDGDKPGAQKVAARFNVSGYPTMVLFTPAGAEVIRLPGEVDPERYLLTLAAGLESQAPVKELVARALSRMALTPQQWQLLAFHSWDTDQQSVLSAKELSSRLSELAAAAPAGVIRDRLALKAMTVRAQEDKTEPPERVRNADRALVERLLANSRTASEHRDMFVLYAESSLKYLAPAPEDRAQLAAKWDAALAATARTSALSRIESLDLLNARVDLWKAIDKSQNLSLPRSQAVRAEALEIVSRTSEKYERQAVVPSAAHVLASAGLLSESDELLKSELTRAVSPYYHMLGLASNAKKRGDKLEALRWYEEAWRKSEGPATRLQWGVGYVRELTSLAPEDFARIGSASESVIKELEARSETFFERNQRSLQKLAAYLSAWQGADSQRMKIVAHVKQQLAAKCERLPKSDPGRSNCESIFLQRGV
jgi:hypothetical protein